jgi:hypothetical protein
MYSVEDFINGDWGEIVDSLSNDEQRQLFDEVKAAALLAVQASVYLKQRFVGEDDVDAEAFAVVARRQVRKIID